MSNDKQRGTEIGFRVSLIKTVSPEDIRFNGSEHNSEYDAIEFADFFDDHDKISSEVNPIRYNSGYGIAPARYYYRDFTIIDHTDGTMVIRSPGYYNNAGETTWSHTMNGSLHEVLNYIDRKIFDDNKTN